MTSHLPTGSIVPLDIRLPLGLSANLLDQLCDGWGIWNYDATNTIHLSIGLKRMLGKASAQEIDFLLSIDEMTRNTFQAHFANTIRTEAINFEFDFQLPANQEDFRYFKFKGVKFDSQETFQTHILGMCSNISSYVVENKTLKEKLKRENDIIGATEIGTWEWNLETNTMLHNERWAEIIGYSLEELKGQKMGGWQDLVHPDDKIYADDLLRKHVNGETEFYICENRMKHRLGHWVWILDKGKIVRRDAKGNPLLMCGSHLDITERKNNEILLSEYKNLLDKSTDAASIGMWFLQPKTETIEIGQKTREIMGIASDEQIDIKSILSHFGSEQNIEMIKNAFKKSIYEGVNFDTEIQIVSPSGQEKWVRIIGIPEFEKKICRRIYGLMQDIDEKTRANHRIALQEELFRKTFEFSGIGMALVGPDGIPIKVNKSVSEIIGYSEKELLATNFKDLTHPDDLAENVRLFTETLEGKRINYAMEKRFFHKNGNTVWVNLSVSAVKNDEGKILHLVSQMIDITQLKQAENEVQKLIAVTQEQNDRLLNFAHIVSHNLRSHSGNISMILQLFKGENPKLENNPFITMLTQASDNLIDTISHLNDVAIINSNSTDQLKEIHLQEYIDKAVANVNALLLEADGSIEMNLNHSQPIIGIPAYIDSIILNFLTNAIKYRHESRKVEISLCSTDLDEYISLTIRDNGKGIDLHRHGDKLFGMYKTFHGNKDSRGIGLFITKNQIESIGGKIEVKSQPGEGTEFTIYLKKA